MDPALTVISARSKQQALDWSLVLASQGIECSIERLPETTGWHLIVDANESQRALRALRQYKLENRAPVWTHSLPLTGLIFDWRAVGWFLFLAAIFVVQQNRPSVMDSGLMDRQAVWAGQWWRLFTAVTLHRDVSHLASNTASGILLLGLAMGSFSSGFGLLAAYFAGVAGNLVGLFLYAGVHRSVGASGMIFGALGLLSGQMLGLLRGGLSPRQLALRSVLSGFLFVVLYGLNPDTDVLAHVGGFLAGILLGALLTIWSKDLAQKTWANRVAACLCGVIVGLTWWLAIR